jgi:hypothetical protein
VVAAEEEEEEEVIVMLVVMLIILLLIVAMPMIMGMSMVLMVLVMKDGRQPGHARPWPNKGGAGPCNTL